MITRSPCLIDITGQGLLEEPVDIDQRQRRFIGYRLTADLKIKIGDVAVHLRPHLAVAGPGVDHIVPVFEQMLQPQR